jgi:hypothetical protein
MGKDIRNYDLPELNDTGNIFSSTNHWKILF